MLPVGSEMKHTVVNVMGASGSNETKDEPQRPPRISVFFMAALAVRKFQKFKNNSFEKSLTLQFDKEAAIDELKLLSVFDQHFFKRHAVKLAHFIRKFEMTSRDLGFKVVENIFLYVQDQLREGYEDSDQTVLNFLCVALKFLTLNSEDGLNLLQSPSIVQLLKTGQAKSQVKNTLESLLEVCLKKETEKRESGVSADLLNSIEHLPDLGAEASLSISRIAESVKSANFEAERKPARSMAEQKVTKSQQFISKTVQTVKLKQSARTSEEANFHFVNLSDNMKNRQRITNNNAVSMELKEITEQGDDRSMFRNTWNEVLHLYSLVSDGNILKDDDRNNYLPSKLFDLHYFTGAEFETGKLYSFFIERMCISTFLEVSKNQRLNDKTIEKLMKCITDFDGLVSLLKFGEDFVNTIVNLIYSKYWEAKRLRSPDMAVEFLSKCMKETTEEYVNWASTTQVKQKVYDAAVVEKLICDEINNLRRDAVKAVFNCAVRNKKEVLTKERLEKIYACTQNQEDSPYGDQTFVEYIFKLNELGETLYDFDYKRAFQTYVNLLKNNQMPSPAAMDGIFKFMNHQARDLQRSQELFTDENLTTLFDCLAKVEDEKKIEILEIINVLLEHESSKELSEQNLEKLADCLQPNNVKILKSSLTSLLLTINKSKSISQHVLDKLMSLFHSLNHDEECTSFIVFILNHAFCAEVPAAEDSHLRDSRYVELVSSKLLCDLSVTLNDDEGEWVRFEEPSDERRSSSKISLLAAKVIWRSVENKVPLSSVTVDNLILALADEENDEDKQTKIMVAKCLYGLTEYMSFPRNDHLKQLLDLINSSIYDVGIYVQTAYMNGCAEVASVPPPERLDWTHLENISELYVADDLMLGTIDFRQKINESFFKILLYEARKNKKFNDGNIFMLFNSILYLNAKYVPQVLTILFVYTSVYVVPEATIKAVENFLSVSSYSEKALQVLENVILAGKSSVTSKTLGVFTDCLQSTNSRRRFNSFKLLEQASRNQEIPDRVFHQLELVKAGYALQRFYQSDCKQMIIDFIQKLVDKGVHLPIDTQKALEKEAFHERVLKVWATTAKNKQLIDLHLMNILSKSFKPLDAAARSVNVFFLAIFEFAVKNNQDLPPDLMKKLEDALCTKDLAENVLPVFIYLTQKGEHISRSVNDKLLDRLMVEEDPTQKQELLSSLGSLIQANHANIGFYQSKINTILTKEITSKNQNIQTLCVNSITKLVIASKVVDDELLDKLVEVGTSSNSNKALKCEILGLFNSDFQESYNKSIRKKRKIVQLANLTFNSREELLEQLRYFVELEEGLLPQNYHQLKDILESESVSLQEKTLDLLHDCCCKIGMTDELLNSVAILYLRTVSEYVRKSCSSLLKKAVENGKKLTGTAMEIHSCASGRDDSFEKFSLSRVGHELRRRLGEPTVKELFQLIQNKNHLSSVQTLSDFIYLVTEENPEIPNEGSFLLLIEMCLLQSISLEIALPCYCRIIKDVRKCDTECLDAVVLYYVEGTILEQPLQATLFELLYYASKCSTLSEVCMSFVLKNIESGCYLTRGYAFGILKAAAVKEPKYESKFVEWCELLKQNLQQNCRVDIGNFKDVHDLLEVTVSLEFLNVAILGKEGNAWKRELLISDIFEGLQASCLEKMYFYNNWCVVEKKFTYHESCKILSLIQKCYFYSFSNLLELTSMIFDFKFDEFERLLSIYAPNPFPAIKQKWTMTQLLPRLPKDVSNKYSSLLAEKLCHSFDVKFIDKLFRSLKSINSVCTFEDLISFCLNEKIDLSITSEEEFKLDDFRNSIEANHACQSAKSQPSESERKDFLRHFVLLKDSKWSFFQLHEFVRLFRPSKFSNLLSFLKTLLMYKLPSSYHEEIKSYVLEDSMTFPEIMQKLNKLITRHHSQLVGKEKNFHELLTELEKLNPSDDDLKQFIRSDSLDIQKHVFDKHADKLNWSEEHIRAWVEEVRESGRTFENDEAIALAYRGNFLVTGHRLTHTQILCCLVALREGNLTGKLLQVATGEGKSTIICVLAIIIALRGTKVDVVTSSPVLAERDAKQKAKLYRMFGLSCSDNSDKTIYLKGKKDCYSADVVYGEMSQFQFDILRDNYSKLGTFGERKSMTAIIDEVDNMLIDDSSKVARLASTVPGMDHLQAIYVFIWQHMLSVLQKFKMFDNKLYFVSGNVGFENDKITLEVADGENVPKYTDLEAYLAGEGDKEFFDEVIDGVYEYLRRKVQQYLDDLLKANQIYIPSNLVNFVAKQKVKWVQSAIEAFTYEENVHYIIRNEEIMPVDYNSTGIVQSSTIWGNGLHQFLQLKHNLKMTSETVTTNFLSNVGFIGRYRQIYGLTGTLGSEAARSVLKDVYKVDLVNIPQRREKQFIQLESIIEKCESDWLGEILSNVILEVQKNRGILVICETIMHADHIGGMLKSKLRPSSVKLYTMNDMDQDKDVEKIIPGEVIIATNLAGRGTDIQTDEIEATGGLHVVLTFLPPNQRVEDQAFGRTARQGKRGTGIMILNAHSLIADETTTNVKIKRDKIEFEQLNEFISNELKLIQVKDDLFSRFCHFLNFEIRSKIREKANVLRKIISSITDTLPTTEETCILAAVEEQWASFLCKLDEQEIRCEDAEKEYDMLCDRLKEDFSTENIIKNPFYCITIANDISVNASSKFKLAVASSEFKQALTYFKKAIEIEKEYWRKEAEKSSSIGKDELALYSPGAAHVGVAWCLIQLKEDDYKQEALIALQTAFKCLLNEMSELNCVQLLLQQSQKGFSNSDLDKQLIIKSSILGSYIRGIEGCIDAIKRSKRLIDVVAIRKGNENDRFVETSSHFKDQEKDEVRAIVTKKLDPRSGVRFLVAFKHLTRRNDCGTIDQALETLRNVYGKIESSKSDCCLNADSCVRINVQSNLANLWSALFNPHKNYKDLTRETAIAKLKEERSFMHASRLGKSLSTELYIQMVKVRT